MAAFVAAYDAWVESPEHCGGPLFEAMLDAREQFPAEVARVADSYAAAHRERDEALRAIREARDVFDAAAVRSIMTMVSWRTCAVNMDAELRRALAGGEGEL